MVKIDNHELTEIRQNLHNDIYDVVADTENTAFRVLRNPNRYSKQPSSKLIIVVDSDKTAEELKSKVFDLIRKGNEAIKSELTGTQAKHYEIKYKVNIVHTVGDIMLSVKSAQLRATLSGKEIKERLQEFKDELRLLKEEETIEDIDNCISAIEPEKNYVYAKNTGYNYRVTFFDGEIRQQISVGNILIVVGGAKPKIVDIPPRKQRSDKKKPVFFITPYKRHFARYEIYIYDI